MNELSIVSIARINKNCRSSNNKNCWAINQRRSKSIRFTFYYISFHILIKYLRKCSTAQQRKQFHFIAKQVVIHHYLSHFEQIFLLFVKEFLFESYQIWIEGTVEIVSRHIPITFRYNHRKFQLSRQGEILLLALCLWNLFGEFVGWSKNLSHSYNGILNDLASISMWTVNQIFLHTRLN